MTMTELPPPPPVADTWLDGLIALFSAVLAWVILPGLVGLAVYGLIRVFA